MSPNIYGVEVRVSENPLHKVDSRKQSMTDETSLLLRKQSTDALSSTSPVKDTTGTMTRKTT